MYENLYEKITDALANDGYLVIENALDPHLCKELAALSKDISTYKQAGISHKSTLDKNRRKDKISWLDADNEATCKYLEFAKGLQSYMNRHLFLGIKRYEAHFALYEAGDFYEKHIDAFKNSKNRVVTSVYYLNGEWDTIDGGELVIYNEKDIEIAKVAPQNNTLVVFMSERYPHEVLHSGKNRHSVAGWFRVDGEI